MSGATIATTRVARAMARLDANVYLSAYSRLRVEIRKDRAEADNAEAHVGT